MAIKHSVVPFPGTRRSTGWILLLAFAVLLTEAASAQVSEDPLPGWTQRYETAQRTFDDTELNRLITDISPVADRSVGHFQTQHLLSKVYLARCDYRRFKRKTFDLTRKENQVLRNQQEQLAKDGLVYAKRAVSLQPGSSEANRVVGELFIHQITGPISGFRFGPKGKDFIEKGIQQDPTNLEARRALGLMYLYNPPFNGGDKEKAAQTFDQLSEAGGGDRCYVLAARAYLEKEDADRAVVRLRKALDLNPTNLEAKQLLENMKGK